MGERQDRLTDGDEDFGETTVAAREEIGLTRAEMTSTIDAIQDRLDPEVLSEHAKDTAHDVTDYGTIRVKETPFAILVSSDSRPDRQADVSARLALSGRLRNGRVLFCARRRRFPLMSYPIDVDQRDDRAVNFVVRSSIRSHS